jgi:hypothetical protein
VAGWPLGPWPGSQRSSMPLSLHIHDLTASTAKSFQKSPHSLPWRGSRWTDADLPATRRNPRRPTGATTHAAQTYPRKSVSPHAA